MGPRKVAMWLQIAAAVIVSTGCRMASEPADPGSSHRQRSRPRADAPRPLEHQASPLPDHPPIRFHSACTLEGTRGHHFSSVTFSPDGKLLAAGRKPGLDPSDVTVWDWRNRKLLRVLSAGGRHEYVSVIAFLPAGDRLVTGSSDCNTVMLWDVAGGTLLDTLAVPGRWDVGVTSAAAFPDGGRVVCCDWTALIELDLNSRTQKFLTPGGGASPTDGDKQQPDRSYFGSVQFTADGSRFATTIVHGNESRGVLVWDAKSCRVVRRIKAPLEEPGFAFSPDGARVAAVCYDEGPGNSAVRVWDTSSGKLLLAGRVFDEGTFDLSFTPDHKYLFVCGLTDYWKKPEAKTAVGVWDATTGKLVNRLATAGRALSLAMSPDGKFLAVPGRDIEIYSIEYVSPSRATGN